MDTEARIAILQEKHRQLEEIINEEMQHPNFDQLRVSQLKKEKLRLKDEMNRLEHERVH